VITMASKPRVNVKPGADNYAAPNEKIIEVSSPGGGCLIALRLGSDGDLYVDVYNADPTVHVQSPKAAQL
jgi:hypothetical protein